MQNQIVLRHFLIRHGKLFIFITLLLFLFSVMFPVTASLLPPEYITVWTGVLDVVLAFIITVLMITMHTIAHSFIDHRAQLISYNVYRYSANLLIVLMFVFIFYGNMFRWDILLPGLAWRFWLLMYILPSGIALWNHAGNESQAK